MVTMGGAARHARACRARAASALRLSQVSCPAQPAITCSLSPPWASPLLGLTTIIPPLSHAPSLTHAHPLPGGRGVSAASEPHLSLPSPCAVLQHTARL